MLNESVRVQVEDKIAILTMDDKDSPVNTWTDAIYAGINEACYTVNDMIAAGEVEGVVIISGKAGTFHTGANLNKKAGPAAPTRMERLKGIDFNQMTLKRIGAIKAPVVAAIDGHCMGGGLELALVCTARIAKESKKTLIGLSETNVGLFPAGGGTQRLPRLIGLKAVEMILDGTIMSARQALDAGIIDRFVCESCDLLVEAKAFARQLARGEVRLSRPELDFSDIDAAIEAAKQKELIKRKGRLLPAQKYALQVMQEGLKDFLFDGLELEKRYFLDVSASPEHKGLVHSFALKSLTDKPQKMMTPGFTPKEIKKAGLIGLGSMGRGIAICILRDTKIPVVVKDTPEALAAGISFIEKTLSGLFAKKRIKDDPEELMKRLIPVTDYEAFRETDIVIEAIVENIDAKVNVFKELFAAAPGDCIVVSNTSSLSINKMAEQLQNPERFAGLHFFSPVWVMELTEIVRGEKTSQETIDNLLNFAGMIRKRPLVCNDSQGFVVNAVLAPQNKNGLKYLEEGNSIELIDKAMTDFGFKVGPIKLMDEIGIDVLYHIRKGAKAENRTINNMYEAGRYGLKKNGKGFFLADGSVDPEAQKLVHVTEHRERSEEEMIRNNLAEQVVIAKGLLDRKIIDDPRMVDIGMIYGTGYPQDKGGPLKWADITGLSEEMFGQKFYG